MVFIHDRESIDANLKDAGCSPQMAEDFFCLLERDQKKDSLSLLRKHRFDLLDSIHEGQRKLDCLDYLIRKLEKGEV